MLLDKWLIICKLSSWPGGGLWDIVSCTWWRWWWCMKKLISNWLVVVVTIKSCESTFVYTFIVYASSMEFLARGANVCAYSLLLNHVDWHDSTLAICVHAHACSCVLLALKQSYNNIIIIVIKPLFGITVGILYLVSMGPGEGGGGHYTPVNVIPSTPCIWGYWGIWHLYIIAANSLYLNIVHTRSVESPRLPPPIARQCLPMSNPDLVAIGPGGWQNRVHYNVMYMSNNA